MTADIGPAAAAPVVVVGAGPVGLTLALRLADLGVDCVVLEASPRLRGEGSKALCMQRETLESWGRLGFGDAVASRGVSWRLGRTFYRDTELFETRLGGSESEHYPPFVNISQTEVEELMVARCESNPRVTLRWEHQVVGVSSAGDSVTVVASSPGGDTSFSASYVVAADGGRSTVRGLAGVGFPGHSHADKFLIADIKASLPFPDERRFYFDPPWNPGRQVLVHPQPDSVWRIDWQVPPDTDLSLEQASGRLDERIRKIVGDAPYDVVWLTLYRFHQRVADRFRAGRVFLVGDAAHVFSPFGARGLNSGVADAENLAWKLAWVLAGRAPESLLDTYDVERRAAALENLAVTDATMRFMVPPDAARRLMRNGVLRLSRFSSSARARVDSGRLCQPHTYVSSPIVEDGCGQVLPDGPVTALGGDGSRDAASGAVTRLRQLVRGDVTGVLVAPSADVVAGLLPALPPLSAPLVVVVLAGSSVPASPPAGVTVVGDSSGALAQALAPDGLPANGRLHVVRPDWHVASTHDLHAPTDVASLDDLARAATGG